MEAGTRVVSDGVEGIYVDLHGECHHEREQVKNSRRQSDAPGEDGEEIKSPKRKIIRVGIRRNTGLRERSK